MAMKRIGWSVFIIAAMSFLGGIFGGFLGVGVLDNFLFDRGALRREIVLQESSVIIDVAKQLEPSVVSITSEGEERFDIFGRRFEGQMGSGTGVIVSEDGLIMTNKHVVPLDSDITVSTSDGKTFNNVKVVDRDPFNDVAFLRLETDEKMTSAELGDSDQIVVGQRVIAIGNALGQFDNTVTSGIISGIGRPVVAARSGGFESEQLEGLLQTDAAINPGNSGGPLVNIEGQVIGINTAIAGGGENIGFAIPVNQLKSGLASIEEHGRLIKPYLGVRYVLLNPELASKENLTVNEGAYLVGGDGGAVLAGSPAEKAGLRAGDIITNIGGNEITTQKSPAALIARHKVGERLELTYIRDGKEHKTQITLQEVPSDLN